MHKTAISTDIRIPIIFALTILLASLLVIVAARAQNQTVIRDAGGRTIGTISTDSQGTQTFHDAGGRTTGTASTDSQGATTFRDAGGRTTGTAASPRR